MKVTTMLLESHDFAIGVEINRAYAHSIGTCASISFVVQVGENGAYYAGIAGLKEEAGRFFGVNRIAHNWKMIEKLEEMLLIRILTAKFGSAVIAGWGEKGEEKGQIAEQGELFPPGA